MEAFGRLLDKQQWMKYTIHFLASGILVAGGAVASEEFWSGLGIAVVGLAVIEMTTYAYDRYSVAEDARQTIRQTLHRFISNLENTAEPGSWTLRANIMLVVDGSLRMGYSVGDYPHAEKQLIWNMGQGCCGIAWEQGLTKFAPADFDPPELPMDPDKVGDDRPWNMSREQVTTTRDTTAVISVPVRRRDDSQIMGIFNVDDTKPREESLLSDPRNQSAIEAFGTNALPPFVERAGTDVPREILTR